MDALHPPAAPVVVERARVCVERQELEIIRLLIEVHDGFEGPRLTEARRRLRALLELEG